MSRREQRLLQRAVIAYANLALGIALWAVVAVERRRKPHTVYYEVENRVN